MLFFPWDIIFLAKKILKRSIKKKKKTGFPFSPPQVIMLLKFKANSNFKLITSLQEKGTFNNHLNSIHVFDVQRNPSTSILVYSKLFLARLTPLPPHLQGVFVFSLHDHLLNM